MVHYLKLVFTELLIKVYCKDPPTPFINFLVIYTSAYNYLIGICCFGRYSIKKPPDTSIFEISLTAVICIDGVCSDIDILSGTRIQSPSCDGDAVSQLPGDGSVAGFLEHIGGQVTDAAKEQVLEHLRIEVCKLPKCIP